CYHLKNFRLLSYEIQPERGRSSHGIFSELRSQPMIDDDFAQEACQINSRQRALRSFHRAPPAPLPAYEFTETLSNRATRESVALTLNSNDRRPVGQELPISHSSIAPRSLR